MTGIVREPIKIEVKIPVGIKDGDLLRVKGKGNYVLINDKEDKFGNLYIKVNIKNIDNRFEFKGNDVYSTQSISLSKVLLGGKETFHTLYGKIERDIPK